MSKKKNRHKAINRPSRGVLSIFNIPLPDELRIPMMLDASGLRAIKATINELEAQAVKLRNVAGPIQKVEVVPSAVVQALAHIATNAWRAKNKLVDPETGEAKEEMKRVYRHIEAIFETLKQIDVKTIDPVGRAYDSGMALKVVSFEQTPGLSKEEIKETIKPSVAWQGRLIQMGEVIVGTPQTA
jgi:hypothetical protein